MNKKKVKDILLEYFTLCKSNSIRDIEDSGITSSFKESEATSKLALIPSLFLDKEVLDLPKILKKDSKNEGISMMIDSGDMPIYFICLQDNSFYVSYLPNEVILKQEKRVGNVNVKEVIEARFDLSIDTNITNLIYDTSILYEYNKLTGTILKDGHIVCCVKEDKTLDFISLEDKEIVNDLWKRGKINSI